LPNAEYDPKAWSRIPEYGIDMANDLFCQPVLLVPTVLGFTAPGDSILEVGCGGQGYANRFKGTGINYTGLDITPEYLRLARENFPEFRFIDGDAREMPFDDKSFEVSFSNNLLLHLIPEDAEKVFREMLRVTRKAVIIISLFAEEDKLGSKEGGYAEEDGRVTTFIYNVLSYARFRAKGWVTYTAPPHIHPSGLYGHPMPGGRLYTVLSESSHDALRRILSLQEPSPRIHIDDRRRADHLRRHPSPDLCGGLC